MPTKGLISLIFIFCTPWVCLAWVEVLWCWQRFTHFWTYLLWKESRNSILILIRKRLFSLSVLDWFQNIVLIKMILINTVVSSNLISLEFTFFWVNTFFPFVFISTGLFFNNWSFPYRLFSIATGFHWSPVVISIPVLAEFKDQMIYISYRTVAGTIRTIFSEFLIFCRLIWWTFRRVKQN